MILRKKTAAWKRKEGKNPKGGLNEKGRRSYEKENPGSNLKAPVKSGDNPRRGSFLVRMGNMEGPERDSKGKFLRTSREKAAILFKQKTRDIENLKRKTYKIIKVPTSVGSII